MSKFTFTESSDDSTGDEWETSKHLFRRLREGRESLVGVECTPPEMWDELEERVGDDWIAYQYLGTKEEVNRWLAKGYWDSIESMPHIAMATDRVK